MVQGLASLAWLVALGALGFAVFSAARGRRFVGGAATVIIAVVAALVLTVVAAGLVFIQPEELGIVITAIDPNGIRSQPLGAGLHWIVPFAERVERYSILRQTYTMAASATEGAVAGDDSIPVRTKDGQQVNIDASVIYAVDPTKVVKLYTTWKKEYENGLVRPQARGIIRDVSSQYGVDEIVTSKRAEMEQTITDHLTKVFADNNLVLVSFVLRNINFSDVYAKAVEQKQIAEQQALQAQLTVEQKKQEAEQVRQTAQGAADAAVISAKGAADARIIQADAEAKALNAIAAALKTNQDLLTYTYIQKLAPNVQVMYLPSGQPYLLPLPGASSATNSASGSSTVPAPTVVPTEPAPAPTSTP
jgi:regulator of protease activity HflC (stomatin/prohibitin superfamily)